MSNSPMVDFVLISPHKNSPRNNSIKKITIHHMAGNMTVEACGRLFQSRQASSNYGIDNNGRVGMYVEEKDRSWCSASPSNDHQAITIECANDGGAPDWHVSDKVLSTLIDLCVDICERNGIKELIYTGDTSGNLTRHNMFCATACPGPYLQSKFPWIAEQVNSRLGGGETKEKLKIGYASPGDIRTFINLLASLGVSYTESGGYITTSEVNKSQRLEIEAKAKELVVPCVVVSSVPVEPSVPEEPDEPSDDYKAKYEEAKKEADKYKGLYEQSLKDMESFKNVIRNISKELEGACK